MAVVARHSSAVELIVTQIRHSVNSYQLENHYVLCHKHCITFKSDRLHRDRYNCRFSLDSNHVGVSSWNGHLLIFDVRLNLKCVVCPGLIDRLEDHMANERCFDFDYRFLNRRIAVGTANRCVYLCNIQSNSVVRKRRLGVSASCTHSTVGIQSVKYSRRGHVLAVAISDGTIHLLDPDSLQSNHVLDGVALDNRVRLCNVNGRTATAISMSFDTFEERLAVSYTDGFVRIWQLPVNIDLQHLCRKAILKATHLRDLKQLPLPKRLIEEIYPIASEEPIERNCQEEMFNY